MLIDRRLHRGGGGNLLASIPKDIARTYDLSPGDTIRWNVRDDGITIQFLGDAKTVSVPPAEGVLEAAE